ncbi:MAG: tight adherence protein [Actinomycetota bacterium]|nr:tight adherence protein [Actinomycetota bacterium]
MTLRVEALGAASCVCAARLVLAGSGPMRLARLVRPARLRRGSRPAGPALLTGVVAAFGSAFAGSPPLVTVVAAAVTSAVVASWLKRRQAREVSARREMVVELCQGLAAELRSGASPGEGLVACSRGLHGAGPVAAAGPDGAVAALRDVAGLPGAEPLSDVLLVLRLSERTGSGLAVPVSRLAEALREQQQLRREVAAQLASPRATALLLALLPAFGVLLGQGLGGRPVAVLLGSTLGNACLALGAGLSGLGLMWMRAIAVRAEPP